MERTETIARSMEMSEDSTLPATLTYAMKSYLNAAYTLRQDGEAATTLRLSQLLERSPASVTNMSKRLHTAHLVRHTRYHGIELTERGFSIAHRLLCRRRTLERYLAEALNYSVDNARKDAERLELYISDELEARMRTYLDYPAIESGVNLIAELNEADYRRNGSYGIRVDTR